MVAVLEIAAPVETERCGGLYHFPCRTKLSAESWSRWELILGVVHVRRRPERVIAQLVYFAASALRLCGIARRLVALVSRDETSLVTHDQMQQVGLFPCFEQGNKMIGCEAVASEVTRIARSET